MKHNDPFVPKYDKNGVELGQVVEDDPRIGSLVKQRAYQYATFQVTSVWRWSNGLERFSTELHDGIGPTASSAPSTEFLFVN